METCKIYLSGGMGNLSFEQQTKWRKAVMDEIRYGDYDCQKKPLFFNPVDYYNFEEERHKTEREVMEFDLHNLRNSDLVIVNFNDEKSLGTAMELILAKELHIPVVGINTDKKQLHPWLTECCGRMCESLREAVDYTIEFYLN